MAGARREVSDRETRGFRRRKGCASLVRRFVRRREKKRKRRRWRRRMRERERERRKLGDLKREALDLGLWREISGSALFQGLDIALLRSPSLKYICSYQVPKLQPGLRGDEHPQRRSDSGGIEIIIGLNNGGVSWRLRRLISNSWRSSFDEIPMQSLVFFSTDGISKSVAQDGVHLGGAWGRRWIRLLGRHVDDINDLNWR